MNKAKVFDIHSHVHFAGFDENRDEVIRRMLDEGIGTISVGTQRDTSEQAIALAHKINSDPFNGEAYATVGLHPIHTDASYHDKQEFGVEGKDFTAHGEKFDYGVYKNLASDPHVVAIGECGLDYYRLDENTKEKQKQAFISQIELANELDKPLMLHIRTGRGSGGGAAYDDALEILKSHAKVKGNVHFFAGDWATAEKYLDFGFTLSFTGVITFTDDYNEVVRNTPLDMMMTETDSPYVAPAPHRGRQNEPLFVTEVVKKMAEIKGISYEKVAETTTENTRRVFELN